MRRRLPLLAPAAALSVVWAVALFHGPTGDAHITDVNVYRGYADALGAAHKASIVLKTHVNPCRISCSRFLSSPAKRNRPSKSRPCS